MFLLTSALGRNWSNFRRNKKSPSVTKGIIVVNLGYAFHYFSFHTYRITLVFQGEHVYKSSGVLPEEVVPQRVGCGKIGLIY